MPKFVELTKIAGKYSDTSKDVKAVINVDHILHFSVEEKYDGKVLNITCINMVSGWLAVRESYDEVKNMVMSRRERSYNIND